MTKRQNERDKPLMKTSACFICFPNRFNKCSGYFLNSGRVGRNYIRLLIWALSCRKSR